MLKLLYSWEEEMMRDTMLTPEYADLFANRTHCGNSYVKLRAEVFLALDDVPPDDTMRELWKLKLERKLNREGTD